jgi:hypothetical protein
MIDLAIKYPKLGLLGLSFNETQDKIKSLDENRTRETKRGPNCFSQPN